MHIDAIFGAIGRYAVRFRWLVVLLWIVAAFAAITQLPSLSSVTQSSNSKFLPASAPSEHAAELAAPFGTANLLPIPVLAARADAPLTPADITAVTALQAKFKSVTGVKNVLDAGISPGGHAVQLVVLAMQAGGNPNATTDLVNALRAKIAQAGLPAGLQVHLAGDIAIQVDQQKASGNTGNKVQDYAAILIIVLLVLIFRSLTLALVTLAPAFVSGLIAGPLVAEAAKHGLQVSPLAQYLMIVLVLGAGTDYGLFLVFRVREELRASQHGQQGANFPGSAGTGGSVLGDLIHPRPAARDAIVRSVTRVGESITFSAATVIAAVLTLLLASFPFYSNLGVPFAIAIGVILIAGLTLLPALLSIRLSLLAVKRTTFRAIFGRPKLLPWNIQGAGLPGVGPDRRPDRGAPRAYPADRSRRVRRACARGRRLYGGRIRRQHGTPRRQRLGSRAGPADQVLPAVSGQPDQLDLPVHHPGLAGPGAAGGRRPQAARHRILHAGDRAAEPRRRGADAGQFSSLHARLGPAKAAARAAAGGQQRAETAVCGLPGELELRQPGRPHRAVLHRPEGRRPG